MSGLDEFPGSGETGARSRQDGRAAVPPPSGQPAGSPHSWLGELLEVAAPDVLVTARGVELPLGELGYWEALPYLADLEVL